MRVIARVNDWLIIFCEIEMVIMIIILHHSNRLKGKLEISLWSHQMETFTTLLAICAGNSSVTGEFTPQRPGFDVFL